MLRLSVGDGRGMPRYGPRPRGGLHLQVRNDGPLPVRLVSGSLSPGQWRLELDTPTTLEPGATTVLPLARSGDCSVLAELRSSSAVLRVEAVVASGRRAVQTLDLTAAQLAYGGGLDEALSAPHLACSAAAEASGLRLDRHQGGVATSVDAHPGDGAVEQLALEPARLVLGQEQALHAAPQ